MPTTLEEVLEWLELPEEEEVVHQVYDGQDRTLADDKREQLANLLSLLWKKPDRHVLAMAVAGALAKTGYTQTDAERVVIDICRKASDEETGDRLTAVRDTYKAASLGQPVMAFRELYSRMGDDTKSYFQTLLGNPKPVKEDRPDRPPPHEIKDPYKIPFRLTERQNFPSFPMLMKGIIPSDPRGCVGYLVGLSQSFKSYLSLDWAGHISEGMEWHGHPTTQAQVLYVAAEGQYRDLLSRLRAWETHHKLKAENLFTRLSPINLSHPDDVEEALALIARVEGLEPRLIILDTLSQCAGDIAENSSDDARKIYASCKKLGEKFGATVLVVHHRGKSEGAILRGSSAFFDDSDFVHELQRPAWQVGGLDCTLNCRKIKSGKLVRNYEMKASEVQWEESGERGSDLVLLQKVFGIQGSAFDATPERS
jgi:hypothetical protein